MYYIGIWVVYLKAKCLCHKYTKGWLLPYRVQNGFIEEQNVCNSVFHQGRQQDDLRKRFLIQVDFSAAPVQRQVKSIHAHWPAGRDACISKMWGFWCQRKSVSVVATLLYKEGAGFEYWQNIHCSKYRKDDQLGDWCAVTVTYATFISSGTNQCVWRWKYDDGLQIRRRLVLQWLEW